jgi:hypothetical protein
MLKPGQFDVNDAWVVFRLNSAPMPTETEGDFNVLCIMDVASSFIFGNELMPVQSGEVTEPVAASLIEAGRARTQSLPTRLLLASELDLERFAALAEKLGVEVQWLTEEELSPLTAETREIFREDFEKRRGR